MELFCNMASISNDYWKKGKAVHPLSHRQGTTVVGEPYKGGRSPRSWGWQKGRQGIAFTKKDTVPPCLSKESKASPTTAAIIIQEPRRPGKSVVMWQSQHQVRKMSARQGQGQQGTRLGINLFILGKDIGQRPDLKCSSYTPPGRFLINIYIVFW